MRGLDGIDSPQRAKQYSLRKYTVSIIETVYFFFILVIFLWSGISLILVKGILNCAHHNYLILPIYVLVISASYYLLNFPLNFYHSYLLERKFSLSKQSMRDWFIDQIKSGAISYIIGIILCSAFYYILARNPKTWWIIVSIFWIIFSLILAKLVPIFIIPIFFKYKKLSDDELKERIMNLAHKMQVKLLDCFEIDLSKKSLKGNAALVGWGSTRRVLLGDTLKDKYSHDEIEVILAHEFAHYRLKHIVKLILSNAMATLIIFYVIFRTSRYCLALFGLSALSDISALPLVVLYFSIFGIIMQPLECYISRRMEINADMLALKITGLKVAFVSMMEKLSAQNLADRNPHPIIKFFFFDHPPIDERISRARNFKE